MVRQLFLAFDGHFLQNMLVIPLWNMSSGWKRISTMGFSDENYIYTKGTTLQAMEHDGTGAFSLMAPFRNYRNFDFMQQADQCKKTAAQIRLKYYRLTLFSGNGRQFSLRLQRSFFSVGSGSCFYLKINILT